MIFTLDREITFSVGQRFVLQHRQMAELVMCRVTEVFNDGYKAETLFLRTPTGYMVPENCFIRLDLDGNSQSFGRDDIEIVCKDYEVFGEHIVIPDYLTHDGGIDYVCARVLE